ncbi:MAG: helix-turn-helix domain-containing protein [Bryobacteraceae bacterium]
MDTLTSDNLTPVQAQVLNALAQGATITDAARIAGLHRTTIYHWIKHQPDFEGAVDDARAEYAATLRDELQVLSRDALATLRSLLDDPATPHALPFKVAMAILRRPQSLDRDWRLPFSVEDPQDRRSSQLDYIEKEGEAVAEYLRRKRMLECVESVECVEIVPGSGVELESAGRDQNSPAASAKPQAGAESKASRCRGPLP